MPRIKTKRLIFLAYFLGIFVLRRIKFFNPSFVFFSRSLEELFFWLSGAFLGAYFFILDQLFYVYFTQPQLPLSWQIKELLKQRQIKRAFAILSQNVEYQKLTFRSALFQVVWLVLALFTLTSTNSVLGKAMVMAIGFGLLLDEWRDFVSKRPLGWLFWQIKREVTSQEQKYFLYLMSLAFAFLSLLLL